ncbi:flavodoxin family protein [Clostridium sp. CX1]|uniref:Flavodoxin family protein n=1 Tax=Clostridium tanneri TaxID=3037988 RepID=A0ABU4JTS1_9CLOT|nr:MULTISPECIES: flavodoxin family protein [unclassified Clostridium]MCT8975651.1 flavodoxin family protein [Clostridium sp. CX1]MDW8801544.1 flavodoxin family protein [Clostridium sp. A1-XYC3]
MKVIGINGSPRKQWNTATLLNKALEGSASQGAETELIHLYDLNFKGCTSCFACRIKDGKSYGKCAMRDDLTAVLEKIQEADALILGSPMYLGAVTGETRSFIERLMFPLVEYTKSPKLTPKKMPTAFIYTMGAPEKILKDIGYDKQFDANKMMLKRFFGEESEYMYSADAYQFDDYSKVVSDMFELDEKIRIRKEVFPKDCDKAFHIGVRLVK